MSRSLPAVCAARLIVRSMDFFAPGSAVRADNRRPIRVYSGSLVR